MDPQGGRRPKGADLVVVAIARLLSKLHPFVIAATVLVLCLAIYAVLWALQKHS